MDICLKHKHLSLFSQLARMSGTSMYYAQAKLHIQKGVKKLKKAQWSCANGCRHKREGEISGINVGREFKMNESARIIRGAIPAGYASALDNFLAWYRAASGAPLCKAVVNAYKAYLKAAGLSASTINVRLCAVRRLVAGGGRQRADPAGTGGQHCAGARRRPARRAPGQLAGSPPGGTIDSGANLRNYTTNSEGNSCAVSLFRVTGESEEVFVGQLVELRHRRSNAETKIVRGRDRETNLFKGRRPGTWVECRLRNIRQRQHQKARGNFPFGCLNFSLRGGDIARCCRRKNDINSPAGTKLLGGAQPTHCLMLATLRNG